MFKWKLRSVIESRGYTQAELSLRSGVAKNTINVLCKGKGHSVSLRTLSKLCKALSVEPWDILSYDPNGKIVKIKDRVDWTKNSL